MSEDVILDTCAFELLLKKEYVERIIECCDQIYVTKNSLNKERKGVREVRIGFQIFFTHIVKLQRHQKFKGIRVSQIQLLSKIDQVLRKCGADDGDLKVATLAFNRKNLGQSVRLVTKDHCFTDDSRRLFENHEIIIRNLKEEEVALLQADN